MAYGPPQLVEGQPRVGLPFGLFSVLSLRGSENPHWANGIEWEAMTCAPASGLSGYSCENPVEKFFRRGIETGKADPFVVYGSSLCGTPGGRATQEGEERATAHLLAREEGQAEAHVWGILAQDAEDQNTGGALTPEKALAVLEGWFGESYGSLGVIHGSRRAISLLGSSVKATGSRLFTRLGTPVSAGGGYPGTGPDGQPRPAGEEWLFASPALFGYRGTVFSSNALDTRHNDYYSLSEREYVIGFDPCGVAAVRMTV